MFGAKRRARAGEQQAQVIVDLGHGAHRGAWIVRSGFLLDRDGRGEALDHVHIGLVHQLQELPGVGREALHVAALAFGIQRVKCQAGLARAAQAGDDDQLIAWNIEVNILKIVRSCPADADGLQLQGVCEVSAVGGGVQGCGRQKSNPS